VMNILNWQKKELSLKKIMLKVNYNLYDKT
jgi:hypothetical protein